MATRCWPDLAKRAEIEKKRANVKILRETLEAAMPPAVVDISNTAFGQALSALLGKVVEETIAVDQGMTEDGYVAHLKECANCRRNVAALAREGVKIPSKILVAAGVEILN
jgi:hypothetical protein